MKRLATAAKAGAIPGGTIEDGTLKIERLTAAVPAEAEDLVLDLYKRLPDIRITDLLLEIDEVTGFTEAFTHIRTGAPCTDKIGLLMNETGHKIREQYADTGNFTGHVFAVTALLGFRFIPRIRDLPVSLR